MRRRISLLVAGTTSAVVLAFVIPLCLLVRTMAADRAVADADEEARNIAVLVSSVRSPAALADVVAAAEDRSVGVTTVIMSDGSRLGSATGIGAPGSDLVARARAGSAFTLSEDAGTRIVVPVVTPDGTDVVHTWVSHAQMRRGVTTAWLLLSLLGIVLTALALLVADQIGRRASTPVIRVALVADRLREGDLEARAVPEGPPETQALATALNRLAERVKELLVAERAAVGDLSHRLRTPVTALRIDVDRVEDAVLAERLQGHVGNLQRTVDAIVKDARRPVRHEMDASCDAVAVVGEAVAFWAPLAEDERRTLRADLAEGPLLVVMDPADLRDVVDILIDNVFAHTPEGTDFAVSVRRAGPESTRSASRVVLEVVDHPGAPGGGVSAADRSDRPGSDPVRTAAGRSGLGLGIARRAVSSRGGELVLSSTPSGTRVTVQLPVVGGR